MIRTDESRAKAAATRAATQAAKEAQRATALAVKTEAWKAAERAFPPKCSVQINAPRDKTRHGKFGHVVTHNEGEIGVRMNVENPKARTKPEKEGKHPGISAWYLPSELIRALPPKRQP